MLTDEEIVARVQAGQGELFELIFDRHFAPIARSVRGYGLPEADVEDLVSETFIRAFARIGSFDAGKGTRYLSYLYAIAHHLCIDRIRERRRAPQATFLEDDEVASIPDDSEEGDPLTALLKREQLDCVRAALALLRPADREIIALSYERQLSCKEIMEVMQKPSTTAVTTHLYKAMKRLRALVLFGEAGTGQSHERQTLGSGVGAPDDPHGVRLGLPARGRRTLVSPARGFPALPEGAMREGAAT